jgi:predicted Rdx family selenoprotein
MQQFLMQLNHYCCVQCRWSSLLRVWWLQQYKTKTLSKVEKNYLENIRLLDQKGKQKNKVFEKFE